jgi:SAM-dependent methyltransferase
VKPNSHPGQTVTARPDLYDWLYQDYDADIEMYIKLAQEHDTVLECGIGTGRIAIPMVNRGKIVHGIDYSKPMLTVLSEKVKIIPSKYSRNLYAYEADMRNFSMNRKFSFAFSAFSTFNYLLTLEEQRQCLLSIRDHLEENGLLILELISFSLFPDWLCNNKDSRRVVQHVDKQGRNIRMEGTFQFDSASQIVQERRYFEIFSSDDPTRLVDSTTVVWTNRLFFLGEIILLLGETGFNINNIYGTYDFRPYKHDSEFIVVVAQKKCN